MKCYVNNQQYLQGKSGVLRIDVVRDLCNPCKTEKEARFPARIGVSAILGTFFVLYLDNQHMKAVIDYIDYRVQWFNDWIPNTRGRFFISDNHPPSELQQEEVPGVQWIFDIVADKIIIYPEAAIWKPGEE